MHNPIKKIAPNIYPITILIFSAILLAFLYMSLILRISLNIRPPSKGNAGIRLNIPITKL